MIRFLIFGFFVVIAVLGWLVTSSPDTQVFNTVKSPSKTFSQETSPVIGTDLVSSGKSPAPDFRSKDNSDLSSPSAKQSLNFPNAVKPSTTLDSTPTLPTTAASAGSSFSTEGSGSGLTATSYDPSSAPSNAGFGAGPIREITIPVPVGAKVPALFQENDMTIWIAMYLAALDSAAHNGLTLYSSRIDGALLPW